MRGEFAPTKANDIEYTLVLTASLSQWKIIREQLKDGPYPACADLRNIVTDVVEQAISTFFSEEVSPP